MKTNYEPQILNALKKAGSKAELASGLELIIAKKTGFSTSDLVIDGPYWSDEDIELCIKEGIHILNADSLDMLERIDKIAKKLKKKAPVGLRIFPEMQMSFFKSFMENYISKFGITLSKALPAYKKATEFKNIEIIGISTHIGSMITDPKLYVKTVDRLVKLAADLRDQLGINIKEINLGGGYGVESIDYYNLENILLNRAGVFRYSKTPSIDIFGEKIAGRFSTLIKQYKLPNIALVLEPGRFIVSDSGFLVTKVIAVKDKWIFLDGGANLVPESIFFIRRNFLVANKADQPNKRKYHIAGPTLSTPDILSTNYALPKVEVGDTIVVLDAGAYTISRANQFTLLRPNAVIIKTNGQVQYLRKKEQPEELLSKLYF